MIEFYYAPTPNGWKVAIALEEMGLPYSLHLMRLAEGDQFKPEFLALSPNAKMPAILDPDGFGPDAAGDDAGPVAVFESGAILLYLAEKTGRFLPAGRRGRKEVMEWLFWQTGNQGPMAGQLSHFRNYAGDGDHGYSLTRYKGEYERSLAVLDRRLEGRDYLVGDYSIADMLAFPWAFIAKPLGVSLDEFPQVQAWRARIKDRPAVRRAIDLHKDSQRHGQTAATNRVLFNQSGTIFKQQQA